ncbi:MAG: caspase family protein [Thermoplasmatales archaeon]|nr:MAG: caspase family protein [Thermoplasmatales archaeon]
MSLMDKKLIAVIIVVILFVSILSGCLGQNNEGSNIKPNVTIDYPTNLMIVNSFVMISGTSTDPDGDDSLIKVEVKIDESEWYSADGTIKWSYDWNTYEYQDGVYTISARSWDGEDYSDVQTVTLEVDNLEAVESDSHKWAIFIAASNFPKDNESKLGNGGLYLAEEMAAYLIENSNYATSNIIILFDDGWIRKDNGYGERLNTLQERTHKYDITYGGATKNNVVNSFNQLIKESNKYRDSEVFIWIFNHGYGNLNNTLTGGKLFERSQIFLWDDMISDKELGDILGPLKSTKVCIIIDACFCGGFADKTILNLPTSLILRSGIPRPGRIVISGASKFRKGFASTTQGPLFSLLWFEGFKTGKADGFKPGLLKTGRPSILKIFKNGKVSVEEAFYYARYTLWTDENFKEYRSMQPQITDRYPLRGRFLSHREMFLGED